MLQSAINIARKAHKNQKYGEYNYMHHLMQVQDILKNQGASIYLQAVGILHDALEDVGANYPENPIEMYIEIYEQIKTAYGLNMVGSCISLQNVEKNPNYGRLMTDIPARAVKIADRIANILAGISEKGNPRAKYLIQHHYGFKHLLISQDNVNSYVGSYDNAIRVAHRLSMQYMELLSQYDTVDYWLTHFQVTNKVQLLGKLHEMYSIDDFTPQPSGIAVNGELFLWTELSLFLNVIKNFIV